MSKEEKKHSFLDHIIEDTSSPAPPEPEKKESQKNRNQAFIRYMVFLFGVAFLFVLISLIITQKDSRATISELNQNASSALIRAEQLQNDYREAVEENQELSLKVQELEAALQEAQEQAAAEAEAKDAAIAKLEEEKNTLLQEKNQSAEQNKAVQEAYELLCQAQAALSEERYEDCKTVMDKLAASQDKLGQEAKALSQRILQALEEMNTTN